MTILIFRIMFAASGDSAGRPEVERGPLPKLHHAGWINPGQPRIPQIQPALFTAMEDDMATKWQFGSKARERLYSREEFAAHQAGRGKHPICPHCDLPVTPDQAWDECHIDVPKALGGKRVGVGHRKCNQLDNNQVVTPMVARVKEVRKRHLGIKGPGLGRNPMRCGRRSGQKAKIGGGVEPRLTLAQQLRALNEKRFGFVRGEQ